MTRLIAVGAAAGAQRLLGAGDDDDSGNETTAPAAAADHHRDPDRPAGGGHRDDQDIGFPVRAGPFGGDDRAIYYFEGDTERVLWRVRRGLAAGPDRGRSPGRLAPRPDSLERPSGTTAQQVTHDGHPLYYYVDDPKGEVACHNVSEFGGPGRP